MALSSRMSVVVILIGFTFSLNMCVESYDYLALAHQWQPGYCNRPDIKIKCQKSLIVDDKFSIHGLWPSNQLGPDPHDCPTIDDNGRDLDVNKMIKPGLVKNLKTSWISSTGSDTDLWEAQWKRHGTCYYDGKTHKQKKYFETAYNFWNRLELFKALTKAGIVPVKGGKVYSVEDATKAFKKHYTQDTVTFIPEFKCSKEFPHELYEVIMCLDHDGENLINCTRSSTCGKQFLWKLEE